MFNVSSRKMQCTSILLLLSLFENNWWWWIMALVLTLDLKHDGREEEEGMSSATMVMRARVADVRNNNSLANLHLYWYFFFIFNCSVIFFVSLKHFCARYSLHDISLPNLYFNPKKIEAYSYIVFNIRASWELDLVLKIRLQSTLSTYLSCFSKLSLLIGICIRGNFYKIDLWEYSHEQSIFVNN